MSIKYLTGSPIFTRADLSQTTLTSLVTNCNLLDDLAIELIFLTTAAATVTYSTSSGAQTIVIEGVTVSFTAGASDAATAAAAIAAINANTTTVTALGLPLNATVIATVGSTTAKVFVQSIATGSAGNAYTITVTGTGATVTGGGTFSAGTSPTGTFAVQASIDYSEGLGHSVINAGNWVSLPLNPAPVASGSDGVIFIDITQFPGTWIRTTWTATSGAGLLTGLIAAKGL